MCHVLISTQNQHVACSTLQSGPDVAPGPWTFFPGMRSAFPTPWQSSLSPSNGQPTQRRFRAGWLSAQTTEASRSSIPNLILSDQNVSRATATESVPNRELSRYTAELGEEKRKLLFFISENLQVSGIKVQKTKINKTNVLLCWVKGQEICFSKG